MGAMAVDRYGRIILLGGFSFPNAAGLTDFWIWTP
jgi:hypothetical protein